MAQLPNTSLLAGLQGTIGKQLVFKKYGNKTVVASYPDMKGIEPSERQKERRKLFKEAVAYAKSVNRDPALKALYLPKIQKGKSVYQYVLKEYLAKHKKQPDS